MGHRKNDQLRILGQRFKSLGMSRRNLMKVAAAAAAGPSRPPAWSATLDPGWPRHRVALLSGRRSVPTRSSITFTPF